MGCGAVVASAEWAVCCAGALRLMGCEAAVASAAEWALYRAGALTLMGCEATGAGAAERVVCGVRGRADMDSVIGARGARFTGCEVPIAGAAELAVCSVQWLCCAPCAGYVFGWKKVGGCCGVCCQVGGI